jgi:hypothetical protein
LPNCFYPNTCDDYNEASPGVMFFPTAAQVGDVVTYSLASQFKDNLLPHATEKQFPETKMPYLTQLRADAALFTYPPPVSVVAPPGIPQ